MTPARSAALAILVAIAAGLLPLRAGAEAPPAAVPPGARFSTPTIGFRTDGIGFRTDGIGFRTDAVGFRSDAVGLRGEPLARPTAEGPSELVFEFGADLLFDFDRAELRPEADPVLRALLAELRARLPRARFSVEGHTDAKGEAAYNQKLSERRAASVRDWLVRVGKVEPRAIATRGFGETRPVAPNTRPDGGDDPVGRQRNRRVVITARAAR